MEQQPPTTDINAILRIVNRFYPDDLVAKHWDTSTKQTVVPGSDFDGLAYFIAGEARDVTLGNAPSSSMVGDLLLVRAAMFQGMKELEAVYTGLTDYVVTRLCCDVLRWCSEPEREFTVFNTLAYLSTHPNPLVKKLEASVTDVLARAFPGFHPDTPDIEKVIADSTRVKKVLSIMEDSLKLPVNEVPAEKPAGPSSGT